MTLEHLLMQLSHVLHTEIPPERLQECDHAVVKHAQVTIARKQMAMPRTQRADFVHDVTVRDVAEKDQDVDTLRHVHITRERSPCSFHVCYALGVSTRLCENGSNFVDIIVAVPEHLDGEQDFFAETPYPGPYTRYSRFWQPVPAAQHQMDPVFLPVSSSPLAPTNDPPSVP